MKNYMAILILIFFTMLSARHAFAANQNDTATLKITFVNTANGKPLVLRDSTYITPAGETYKVTKLKYYISDIVLPGNFPLQEETNFQLVNAAGETGFQIPVKPGNYSSISFLLGIDSLHNCSGAQSGVLDPMNDMFWTWNSGYVMFKLEGTSPSSSSDRNRIEHHVGGYRFNNNVATNITLRFDENFNVIKGQSNELTIKLDLDKYWSSSNNILITEDPVCTLPGEFAKKIASNFGNMFSIVNAVK